jgi:hypothetical protein
MEDFEFDVYGLSCGSVLQMFFLLLQQHVVIIHGPMSIVGRFVFCCCLGKRDITLSIISVSLFRFNLRVL